MRGYHKSDFQFAMPKVEGLMHVSPRKRLWIGSLAWFAITGTAQGAEPIKPEHFAKVRAVIKPQSNEDKWASIGWRTDLWEARKEAAAAGKPLLLREMDGHPL